MAGKLVFKKAVVKRISGNGINVNPSQPPTDISSGDVPDEPTYVTVTFDPNGGAGVVIDRLVAGKTLNDIYGGINLPSCEWAEH